MKDTKVASRYAKALLELAIEQNVLDQVNNDMVELSSLSEESKELQNLFASPIVDSHKKNDIFKALFEKSMQKMSLNFLMLITKNNRENVIPSIAESFVEQYKIHKGIVDVYIASATPLDSETKKTILSKIESISGKTVVTHETVNPELIGGFTVKINDKLLDASIASQLRNLKNILLN